MPLAVGVGLSLRLEGTQAVTLQPGPQWPFLLHLSMLMAWLSPVGSRPWFTTADTPPALLPCSVREGHLSLTGCLTPALIDPGGAAGAGLLPPSSESQMLKTPTHAQPSPVFTSPFLFLWGGGHLLLTVPVLPGAHSPRSCLSEHWLPLCPGSVSY